MSATNVGKQSLTRKKETREAVRRAQTFEEEKVGFLSPQERSIGHVALCEIVILPLELQVSYSKLCRARPVGSPPRFDASFPTRSSRFSGAFVASPRHPAPLIVSSRDALLPPQLPRAAAALPPPSTRRRRSVLTRRPCDALKRTPTAAEHLAYPPSPRSSKPSPPTHHFHLNHHSREWPARTLLRRLLRPLSARSSRRKTPRRTRSRRRRGTRRRRGSIARRSVRSVPPAFTWL